MPHCCAPGETSQEEDPASSCHAPRRRWVTWMPFVSMGALLVLLLAFPSILKSPWGFLVIGLAAIGCPVMCFGAMSLQALAGRK